MVEFADNHNRIIYMYTVHSMPQIAYFMNLAITDVKFVRSHGPILIMPVAIAYCSLNCILCHTFYDRNPYFFLGEWNSMYSPMMAVCLSVVFNLVYYIVASLRLSN